MIYLRGVADPKDCARAPLWRAMAAFSRKGSGMGTPSLKLNTYRWKLPEKWYQVARGLKSPKNRRKSPTPSRTLSWDVFWPGNPRVFETGDATHFRHGENVAAGVPLFGSRSGPMGTKLAHVQFNSSRSNFSRRMSVDLLRYHPLLC